MPLQQFLTVVVPDDCIRQQASFQSDEVENVSSSSAEGEDKPTSEAEKKPNQRRTIPCSLADNIYREFLSSWVKIYCLEYLIK